MADRSLSVPMTLSDLESWYVRGQTFQADLLNNARTVSPRTSKFDRITYMGSGVFLGVTFKVKIPNIKISKVKLSTCRGWAYCGGLPHRLLNVSQTPVEIRPFDGFWRTVAQRTLNHARICLLVIRIFSSQTWPLLAPKNSKFGPLWTISSQNAETWKSRYIRKY